MGSTVIETVLHSTLEKSRKKLMFAAVKANAFYAYAMASGKVEYEDGGREISNPLITNRNPNVTSYEYYDELPVEKTNEFNTVRYGWARVAGSVIISEQEIDENRGQAEIFKILKGKMQTLEESIKEKFGTFLYGAGTGKNPNGLALCIPDDPTTGTLGGLSREISYTDGSGATIKPWQTMAVSTTLSTDNIEETFDDILLDMKQGKNEKPDLILCGKNIYRKYRKAIRDKVQILAEGTYSAKKMYDLGFDGVSFGGVTMLYDEDCPADKAYIINSTYLKMHVLKHVNMKVKELSAPWTQDVIGRRMVWQGQMCLWKAHRTQCVVTDK
jgi:hypothetical protein